ncbi:hypothetical protein PV10_00993 [Exophiala mesophila]|uniref:Bromo domain-containing protein n=1 Tax=Exophiala mesophila TaxID=212818 RepID=A0A0D1ZRH9_EXOME|nr:uncharacterized protein PV10_00993 [Exophiala mesophila]KIV97217.1 hypothetical protein PV10_00993 [Exophiala mesophila]
MPSLKAYTHYETLAFCQLIASHGLDPSSFEDISTSLNANQLIRESTTYDQSRFTATALQTLYDELLLAEKSAQKPATNGDTNTKKRKLSASPSPPEKEIPSDEDLFQILVERLYGRFREQAIKEIRQDEEAYATLQKDVTELEKKVKDEEAQQNRARALLQKAQADLDEKKRKDREASKAAQAQAQTQAQPQAQTTVPQNLPSPDPAAAQLQASLDATRPDLPIPPSTAPLETKASPSPIRTTQPLAPSKSPVPSTTPIPVSARQSAEPNASRNSQPPSIGPSTHNSPGSYPRTLQVPPQRPNYAPINPQHFQPGPHGQPVPIVPHTPGMPMPPPAEFPNLKRANSSGQGRGSPIHMTPQQAYPPYPPYGQAPWPPHMSPQHQFQQTPPYPNQPYYPQSPNGRGMPYQTPHHPQYPPFPQSGPVHYQGQPHPQGWYPPHGQPYGFSGPPNVTPGPRSESRRALSKGRSSTPWKKRLEQSSSSRLPSPTRPEREVSPLTDTESPSQPGKPTRSSTTTTKERLAAESPTPTRERQSTRGQRVASATPSARSPSAASMTSETPTESRRKGRPRKIKAEPPSTPAAIASDNEQPKPSERRGRSRGEALALPSEIHSTGTTAQKRKRSTTRDSITPSLPSPEPPRYSTAQFTHDPGYVVVSKNFHKTALLLINDISTHKLAGIFGKPLSERDAPGYKDLVLRPQDLKSIKAAVSKGGKAAHIAIEAIEGDQRSGVEESTEPLPQGTESESKEGSLGNGMFLVKTFEDIVPPKGIVNSSQLEMEVARVFANAVMFNPLPSSERGFGRSLRLRRNGGTLDPPRETERGDHDNNDDTDNEDDEDENNDNNNVERPSPSQDSEGSPLDSEGEGGIIADTRDMFEDAIDRVSKWKKVESERLAGPDEASAQLTSRPTATAAAHDKGSASVAASVRNSSVSSAVPDEESGPAVENNNTTAATPAAHAPGTARKRRRLAD